MDRLPRLALAAALAALVLTGEETGSSRGASAATTTVDEVTYAFGNDRTEVVVSWHGGATTLFWGPDDSYGSQVAATPSAITPVDIA